MLSRKQITAARAASLLSPEKAMYVPGTRPGGSRRYQSSVAAVQGSVRLRIDGEYANPGTLAGRRPITPSKLGPPRPAAPARPCGRLHTCR